MRLTLSEKIDSQFNLLAISYPITIPPIAGDKIKSIELNSQLKPNNTQEEETVEIESTKPLLPYEYFELIDDKNSQTKKFAKRLNTRKNYEVLFEGSWFQPLFNQKISSPI